MSNKVYYSTCESYDSANIDKSIDFIFNNCEELRSRVNSAQKIVIKPNLLSARAPETAVTTHPQVLISLINRINSEFAGKEILIMDSPAGPFNAKALQKVYAACKMDLVAQETGAKLNQDLVEYQTDNPAALYLKNFHTLKPALDADLIINVAKLKTHCFTYITCATKNMFGLIPGLLKMKYHLSLSHPELFSNMLLDLTNYYSAKTFHFVDGILGMEGFGPSNGTPVETKCLLAASNCVYMDILACHIMGAKQEKVFTITEALKRGIIDGISIDALNVIADSDIKTYDFRMPPERNRSIPFMPEKWIRALNNFFVPVPVISKDKCIGCRECEQICPPQVMKIIDKKASLENYNDCIRCYCCQEVCPQDAIELNKPLGKRLLSFIMKL